MRAAILLALLSTTFLYAQNGQRNTNGQSRNGNGQMYNKEQSQSGNDSMDDQASNGKIVWMDSFEKAMQKAGQEHKPVILYFTGSDWCGWCKKMDQEVFSSPAFADEVGQKFVFVKVDFPMNSKLPEQQARQNAQLKQRYGVTGYPTVVIVDAQGGFIGETGYRSGGGKAYAQWLEQFLTSK